MGRRLRLMFFLLFSGLLAVAQQSPKLTGKVTNTKNEPLAGVTIKVAGAAGGTTTEVDGRFTLTLSPGKKYTLIFTAVGYSKKEVAEVEVSGGQINELNITLDVEEKTGDNVVITTKISTARKESVNSLIAFQKNTNTVASVISAESIRRSPDKNTGEVLKRTPGASLQEGKFIVIRGLADRYNQAMLNGILLTSTEPDRKTFSFDLIPSAMIDNIIINKAFVPEYPGEWAGGLIQVNTKDIPSKNFFTVQIGTNINTQTIGKDFYKDVNSPTDWLGFDNGSRALPAGYTRKAAFDTLSVADKTAIGKQLRNAWMPSKASTPVNVSFQLNGGFSGKLFKKSIGGIFALMYNRSGRYLRLLNRSNVIDINSQHVDIVSSYDDDRYVQDVSGGALGSLSLQLNAKNKISLKGILNINSSNPVTRRNGVDNSRTEEMSGSEMTFKQNAFFTVQASGEHNIVNPLKLKWYGSFTILDGSIPDQRRIIYTRPAGTQNQYELLLSNTLSQQSGSRIYQSLSDYIYTGGGDLTWNFKWLNQRQSLKGGYMLQVKDRLYDAQLFANYLPRDNPLLRLLPADQVFAPENFGNGSDNKIAFSAIKGNTFRYLANTILNAGFLQMDNQFSKDFRVVWGLRVENYDQLIGSVKKWDPRHTYSVVTDFLPGFNSTYKVNTKTNLRFSGSQTVIRPELRELASLNLYDFELNASVQGNPQLKRTKVSNLDARYELYPRAGEMITLGAFYKDFRNAIEQYFNGLGGGASTINYLNAAKAITYGVELEFRKKLDFTSALKHFTFQANGSYIYSRVKDNSLKLNRPLQGQSPYVINAGLMYDLENKGVSATLLFNQIGERIYFVRDAINSDPDIYEAPRPLLDFQLSKKLLNNKAELRLTISDIINRKQIFYQNVNNKRTYQKGVDVFRFTRKLGTTFGITFNYSI